MTTPKPLPHLKTGRPALYNNCMDLECMCELYFDDADERGAPYTMAGLTYFLGFCEHDQLAVLGHKPEFYSTVKKARMRVETQKSEMLTSGKGSTVGLIFDLKNNHGWADRQIIDQTVQDNREHVETDMEREILQQAADRLRSERLKAVPDKAVNDE